MLVYGLFIAGGERNLCLQLHALVMAIFASVIAPFGGFFASGFKRSFKIKDFGDSIPGHGGMTDRMDCQVAVYLLHSQSYNPSVAELDPFFKPPLPKKAISPPGCQKCLSRQMIALTDCMQDFD